MIEEYFDLNYINKDLLGAQKTLEFGYHGIERVESGHFGSLFHLKIIAKGHMKEFLNSKEGKELGQIAKNDNQPVEEWPKVKYLDDQYKFQKYKMEWLVDYLEKNLKYKNNEPLPDRTYMLVVIKQHITLSITKLIKENGEFYTLEEINFLKAVSRICESDPEDFSLLSKYLFLPIFEVTYKKLEIINRGLIVLRPRGDNPSIGERLKQLAGLDEIKKLSEFAEVKENLERYNRKRNDLTHNKLENKQNFLKSATEIEEMVNFISSMIRAFNK